MRISDWSSDVCSSDLKPPISAIRLRPKIFEMPRIEKARMRIKAGQHAIDRTRDQRLIIDLVDIVATYTLKHVHKLIERAIAIPLSLSERSSGRGHERQRPGKCGGFENSFIHRFGRP